MESMKGKVAIITGATSGIGRQTAITFAQSGIKVVAAGRNEQTGFSLVNEITTIGGEAIFVRTNITDSQSVSSLIQTTKNHFGGFDFAFNNAGVEGALGALTEMEEENWDLVMDTNLKGVWLCLKYQIPELMKRGGGVIVNTSTNIAKLGEPGTAIYTASKAGVEALSRVAAIEYGSSNIRVNVVSPGAVDTPMLQRAYPDVSVEQMSKANPMGKIATPVDIANAVLWLCSPIAKYVNGANIVIDGGFSIAPKG